MVSPIDPQMCANTGRLLTEWFEYPEFTEAELKAIALHEAGVEALAKKHIRDMTPDELSAHRKYTNFLNKHRNRKWKNNMTQQEVAARMNEATKMIDPSNFKFLDDDTRERTGLEINPLWMMECLFRSGTLGPKEQISVLKELAQYTHSKAPNINQNTNITASEDWLLELSKAEYTVVDSNPSFQPKQIREVGLGEEYEQKKAVRVRLMQDTQALMKAGVAELSSELGDFTFGDEDDE